MATASSASRDYLLDVITDIQKINQLGNNDAEIFMVLRDHGEYSIDPNIFPDFERFWLHAHVSSKVHVLVDSNGEIIWIALPLAP